MAVFKSLLMSEIRGSVAGATFSRNGNSAYIRGKAIPVNPNSVGQSTNRARLNFIATAWRSLTEPERIAWNDLAATIPYTNKVGDSSFYSGFQLFMKHNLVRLQFLPTILRNAPAVAPTFPTYEVGELSAEQDSTTFGDFTLISGITVANEDSEFVIQWQATYGMSAGKKFIADSQYRTIEVNGFSNADPMILTAGFTTVFGLPASTLIGSRIAVRVRAVHINTGFVAPWENRTAIVAEA